MNQNKDVKEKQIKDEDLSGVNGGRSMNVEVPKADGPKRANDGD